MSQIANFFTLFWIIYFPTCIAYNDLEGFSSVDEVMTVVLMGYTFMKKGHWATNGEPWKEYFQYLIILALYVVYGLTLGRNPGGVWLDLVQWIRPFSVIYCTWILNPQFTESQKKWMLWSMVLTLGSWIFYHPISDDSEFPVLGQLAICTGMSWYLFSEDTKKNSWIALALVLTGMLAPKFKFMGEVVCFIAVIFFLREKLDFKNPRVYLTVPLVTAVVLYVTWERFDAYYVTGADNEGLARPMTYKTAWKLLWDYFPLGPGMGSLGTLGAWKVYSPIYHEYHLDTIWGLDRGGGFICDAFYPTLANYGVVGVFLFYVFWKRRLVAFNAIEDMKYYRIFLMAFACLAIEQTADTSFLSGKGMGYCMLLGLCMNADYNEEEDEDEEESPTPDPSPGGEENVGHVRDDYWEYHRNS